MMPKTYQFYTPFHFDCEEAVVCARPENLNGWQLYHDENDPRVTWTVVITPYRGDTIRAKMSEKNARACISKLSDTVVAEARRSAENGLTIKRESQGGR
jgi:hypothetical protein